MNKKLSIIIPIYNVEKYLKQCLDSVVSQQNEEVEVVAINDGSKDNSLQILMEYSNFTNIKIYDKENTGLSDTRNFGIKNSTGKYLLFLDSDDYLEQGSINKLLETIKSNKDVYIGKLILDCNDNKKVEDFANLDKIIDSDTLIRYFGAKTPVQRYIVKRDFVFNNNLFFLKGRLHEDMAWCNILLDCINDNFEMLEYEWYNYRQNVQGSIMASQGFKNIKDVFEMGEILYKTLKNEYLISQLHTSLYSKLRLYYGLNGQEKKFVEEFINNRLYLFKSCKTKYQLFYLVAKILGSKNALKIVKRFI